MAKNTTNYHLIKPEVTDLVTDTISDLSTTLDMIDTNLKIISDKVGISGEGNSSSIAIGSAMSSETGVAVVGVDAAVTGGKTEDGEVFNASGSVAIGVGTQVTAESKDATNSVAIGNNVKIKASDVVALGSSIESTIDSEITLGRYRTIPGCFTKTKGLTFELRGYTPVRLDVSYFVNSASSTYNNKLESYILVYEPNNKIKRIKVQSIYSVSSDLKYVVSDDGSSVTFTINVDYVSKVYFTLSGFDIKNCAFG